MASATADRLQLLASHIEASLKERSAARSDHVEPDGKHTTAISRSLETLRQGIQQLESEQSQLEESGTLSTKDLREREDILLSLRARHESLLAAFTADFRSSLDSPRPPVPVGGSTGPGLPQRYTDADDDEANLRDALLSGGRSRKSVRFSEQLEDTQELDNTQVLAMHRRIMEEQDEDLDRLAASISRQRELSIQIGDELEGQVQLLDEVDGLVDRHQGRLDRARGGLKKVEEKAREHGSLVVIIVLIIILLVLIIAVK